MISIGGVVGAGLFVGSSTSVLSAGPATFLSYAITGLLIMVVMRMLAEMMAALPEVRTFPEFARRGLGDWAGYTAGWLYWYVWVMTVPIEAIAGARLLQAWVPLSQLQLGLLLMGTMTLVNLLSARSYAEFEFWFASIKVAAILVFIALTAAFAFGWTSPHGATFANLVDHGGFMPNGWVSVLAVVPSAFFAMSGAEITTIAAAESAQSSVTVARLSTTVIWRLLFFYVVTLFLVVAVTPWTTVRAGESPFTLALQAIGIPGADRIMSVIILTAVLSCMNSAFYVSSRVLFILAAHADAPQGLVRLNARRVPVGSVLIAATAGVLGVLAAIKAPAAVFNFLVSSTGALMIFVYLLIIAAQIRLRRGRERRGEPLPAVTLGFFPWLSYAAIAGMVAVLVAMGVMPGLRQDLEFSLVTLTTVLASYQVVRTRRRPGVVGPGVTPA